MKTIPENDVGLLVLEKNKKKRINGRFPRIKSNLEQVRKKSLERINTKERRVRKDKPTLEADISTSGAEKRRKNFRLLELPALRILRLYF